MLTNDFLPGFADACFIWSIITMLLVVTVVPIAVTLVTGFAHVKINTLTLALTWNSVVIASSIANVIILKRKSNECCCTAGPKIKTYWNLVLVETHIVTAHMQRWFVPTHPVTRGVPINTLVLATSSAPVTSLIKCRTFAKDTKTSIITYFVERVANITFSNALISTCPFFRIKADVAIIGIGTGWKTILHFRATL